MVGPGANEADLRGRADARFVICLWSQHLSWPEPSGAPTRLMSGNFIRSLQQAMKHCFATSSEVLPSESPLSHNRSVVPLPPFPHVETGLNLRRLSLKADGVGDCMWAYSLPTGFKKSNKTGQTAWEVLWSTEALARAARLAINASMHQAMRILWNLWRLVTHGEAFEKKLPFLGVLLCPPQEGRFWAGSDSRNLVALDFLRSAYTQLRYEFNETPQRAAAVQIQIGIVAREFSTTKNKRNRTQKRPQLGKTGCQVFCLESFDAACLPWVAWERGIYLNVCCIWVLQQSDLNGLKKNHKSTALAMWLRPPPPLNLNLKTLWEWSSFWAGSRCGSCQQVFCQAGLEWIMFFRKVCQRDFPPWFIFHKVGWRRRLNISRSKLLSRSSALKSQRGIGC